MSFGPSAERSRPRSAVASRKVTVRRHEPPPTSRAASASFRNGPPLTLRPGEQPVEECAERAPQGQLVRDRLGEGERLGQLCRGRSPTHAPALPAACEAPRPLPLRPQPLGDRRARQGGERSEGADAEALQLGIPALVERQERERERLEERLLLPPLDDHRLTGTCHARGGESDEAPPARAGPWVPGRPDGGERLAERRLHPSVEPLDPGRLEHDHSRPDRLHSEPHVFEASQDTLPLSLRARRIGIDEHELRARGERLPETHPRRDARRLGGGGHRTDELLTARLRGERRGDDREPRPGAERRAELESRDEEAGDHGEQVF